MRFPWSGDWREHGPPPGFDYEAVSRLVRDAVQPMGQQLRSLEEKVDKVAEDHATRGDLEKLRREVTEATSTIQASTYTKSEMDLTLRPIRARLKTQETTITEMQQRNATTTERWLTRAGAVAGLLYILSQLMPHFAKAFGF